MRGIALLSVVLVLPSVALGQATADSLPRPRFFTLAAGLGNSLGLIGLHAEKYFARSRLSVYAGLGYFPEDDPGDWSGAVAGAGLRGFTPGVKHRGFLDLSVSQLFVEQGCFDDCGTRYGPGPWTRRLLGEGIPRPGGNYHAPELLPENPRCLSPLGGEVSGLCSQQAH